MTSVGLRFVARQSSNRLLLSLVMAALVSCCAPARPARVPPPAQPVRGILPLLTWLGEFTRPAGATYPTMSNSDGFGSVSGLVRDAQSGQWVGVIDDREHSRVAWLTIDYTGGALHVAPTRMMPLRPGPGVPERVVTMADLESVVALPDGTFLLNEEGHITKGEVWPPVILHATREGRVTDIIPFPKPFRLRLDQTQGVRDNQGFESLALTPKGHLIAGLEQPLIEDGAPTSFDQGGRGRLIEFIPRGRHWRPGRQWRYPIDPTPRVPGFSAICEDGENGLVDLLALTDTTLLSLERACVQDPSTRETANAIQIFVVELDRGVARKSLVLNLSTLTGHLSPALERLDNFEGLAFGPPGPTGGRTLLVMSDDNFRASQKTAFLLFGLR